MQQNGATNDAQGDIRIRYLICHPDSESEVRKILVRWQCGGGKFNAARLTPVDVVQPSIT